MTQQFQPALFVDNADDAVRDTVRGLGGSKKVGPLLWPSKKPDRAEKDLDDCLNRNNNRKLDFEEILLIGKLGRDKGIHLIAGFVNMDLGYAPPVPIDPSDQKAELQRQFHEDVARLEAMARRLRN